MWRHVFINRSLLVNIFHCPFLIRLRQRPKGFTLIELMVVIVIIGLLAGITLSVILRMHERAFVATLQNDLSQAYKTSVAYFSDNPGGQISWSILQEEGYTQTDKVSLTIVDGKVDSLKITATHPNVVGVYEVDKNGQIFKQ